MSYHSVWTQCRTTNQSRRFQNQPRRVLWFACHTQDEIAKAVGMRQDAVARTLCNYETFRFCMNPGDLYEIEDEKERMAEIERRNRAAADHAVDFDKSGVANLPDPIPDQARSRDQAAAAVNVSGKLVSATCYVFCYGSARFWMFQDIENPKK